LLDHGFSSQLVAFYHDLGRADLYPDLGFVDLDHLGWGSRRQEEKADEGNWGDCGKEEDVNGELSPHLYLSRHWGEKTDPDRSDRFRGLDR
jgi:hypothetical protein